MRKHLVCFIVAISCGTALADGPQIQITGDTGKIITRRLFLDSPYSASLTPPTSVYVIPLIDNLGVSYARPNNVAFTSPGVPLYYSGPGLAYGFGYDPVTNPTPFALGSKFGLTFTSGIKRWDGAAFVDAGAAQMQAFTGSFSAPSGAATSSDAGPFASLAIPASAIGVIFAGEHEEAHSSARFRYLGDGSTPSSAPDGVYLLSLQLSSTQAGMQPSDPYYFVLSKNAGAAALRTAVASLNAAPGTVQFIVPEPSSLALALAGFAFRRRRL